MDLYGTLVAHIAITTCGKRVFKSVSNGIYYCRIDDFRGDKILYSDRAVTCLHGRKYIQMIEFDKIKDTLQHEVRRSIEDAIKQASIVEERYISAKCIGSMKLNVHGHKFSFRLFRATEQLGDVHVARDYIESSIMGLKPRQAGPAIMLNVDRAELAIEFNSISFHFKLQVHLLHQYNSAIYDYEKLNNNEPNHNLHLNNSMEISQIAAAEPIVDNVKDRLRALIKAPHREFRAEYDINDYIGKSGIYMIKISDTDKIVHFGACEDLGTSIPPHIVYLQDVDHVELLAIIPCDIEIAHSAIVSFAKYANSYGIFTADPLYIVATSSNTDFVAKMQSYVDKATRS